MVRISVMIQRYDPAEMHSIICRQAEAYLDTVPVSPSLHLSDADFICGGQLRLGATGTNLSIPATVVNTFKAMTSTML